VAVAEHLIPALAQRRVARGRRQHPGLGCGATLRLDPVGSGPSPSNICLEGASYAVLHSECLRQYQCVLHRHAPALAHMRRTGMRRVADEDDATEMPRVKVDPFDGPDMELSIVL